MNMLFQFTFSPPTKDPDIIPWDRLTHSSRQSSCYRKDVILNILKMPS